LEIKLKLTKEEADLLYLVLTIAEQRYETFVVPSKNKREGVLREKVISEHKLILSKIQEKLSVLTD
jgi:hypothetical protein